MGNTWVTNMLHSLDEEGELATPLGPARRIAEHMGSIVAAVTGRALDSEDLETPVQCRRRPGHVRCQGIIVAGYYPEDPTAIVWYCPNCEDNGHISGWQDTLWDKRRIY